MQPFNGFPPGKAPIIRIPTIFFTDLMPNIDHVGELKVTFYCMWALQRQEGNYPYVRLSEAMGDEVLMRGMGAEPDEQAANLQDSLARAVERGTLLAAELIFHGETDTLYFMNSQQGRNAIRAIERGEWLPGDAKRPIAMVIERPDIFRVYEQNIGTITAMIADQLRDAEKEYPVAWIEEAIEIAVEHNARNWRYVQAVLDRWDKEGKQSDARGHASRSKPTKSQFGDKKGDYSDLYD